MTAELLAEIKSYLNVTWDDDATDARINSFAKRGVSYLDAIAGSFQDYEIDNKPKELLMEYCRYVWSDALSEFQTNYESELLSFQQACQIADSIDEEVETDE